VGTEVDLLIEGHGRFDVATAVRIARELERFDVFWFEEPVPPGNLAALREVKDRSRVPIAAGERLYGRWEYREFFDILPADFIQPDPSHVGGIGELKKIAATAETHFLSVCPHNPSGPVANAASLQLAACVPNFFILETMAADVPWRQEITDESVTMREGKMQIPDRPGLGIRLNPEGIDAHPYQPHDLRHYKGTLTDIRPEGGTGFARQE
jgi:galactonate dehydratase